MTRARRLYESGDYKRAESIVDQGLAASHNDLGSEWYWRFRLLKAETLSAQGSTTEAFRLLETPVGSVPHRSELEAQRLGDLGSAWMGKSDYERASECFDRAQALLADMPASPMIRKFDLGQGLILLKRRDPEGAEARFRSALRQAEQQQDLRTAASALGNLGLMRLKSGRCDEALVFFGRALEYSRSIQSQGITAALLTNMGWCYHDLGDLDRAHPLFEESDILMERTHLRSRSATLVGIASSYHARGEFQQAVIWYRKAVEAARKNQWPESAAEALSRLAASYIELGDFAGAETCNREAGTIYEHLQNEPMRAWQMLNSARIAEARQSLPDAESGYRRVVQSNLFAAATVAAHNRLAGLLVRLKRPDEAGVEFADAAGSIQQTRAGLIKDESKITYLASVMNLYHDYVEFLSSRNLSAQALRVAESSRARLLAEKLGEFVSSSPNSRAFENLAGASRTVFLCYWTAPSNSYLWVITGTRTEQFRLPPEGKLAALVDSYNKAIQKNRDPAADGNLAGDELYETLIRPAQRLVPAGSAVAVLPDGPLHELNFETLVVPGRTRHYWIEDAKVSVVPSLTVLTSGSPASLRASLLLIGDPLSADLKHFPRLANAAAEIRSVERNFSSSATVALTGADAQPAAYAQAHPELFSIIHFTSHAIANYQSPLDSAVILSPAGDSFKLYARDIMSHPIHADLVALSSCKSAGARTYLGEGLVGFAWAFLQAGAHNVIAGLWDVDDRSTAQIMEDMYGRIRQGKSPAEALREAKLSLIHSGSVYRKPYYWAPFQLFTRSLPKSRPTLPLAALSSPAGS